MNNIEQEAQATLGQPSMSTLNADVLWHIFDLNANMDNDKGHRVYLQDRVKVHDKQNRALFVTWASSHVCRQWRHILLDSPVIWGKLVDLDGFSSVDTALRDDAIRRSGTSTLWIYGKVFAQKEEERDFFTSTLARNWSRIGRLKVRIQQSKLIPMDIWRVLYKPARHLELFRLRCDEGLTLPVQDDQSTNLFGDDAPILRTFYSWRVDFKFGNPADWMKSIRRLDISYMSRAYMTQWLEMLGQCPQIERLLLIRPFPAVTDVAQKFCSVKLPNLRAIYIIHELVSSVLFLDHIFPQAGCYLQLDTPDDMDNPLSLDTIALAKRVLTRYTTSWYNHHSITSLYLSISHKQIVIAEEFFYRSGFEDERFGLQITCQTIEDLPTLFPLFNIIGACNVENITTIHFEIDIFQEQSLSADVFRFLLKMSNVAKFKSWHPETIPTLISFAQNPEIDNETNNPTRSPLFPLLRTLSIETQSRFYDQNTLDTLQSRIFQFLSWRRDIGRFVDLLDITSLKEKVRIHNFDGMQGLTVLYQNENGVREEYVSRANQTTTFGKDVVPVS